jgi:hypothetical protein
MQTGLWILASVPVAMAVAYLGLTLYAIPAMFTLPGGIRPGLEPLTLTQAAKQLTGTGKTGWELVEVARALVADRIQYSRRNSFDNDERAFERGYGFCTQQAYALVTLLGHLGFDAKAVQAFRNSFPDKREGGHTWVSVTLNGESRFIDSMLYDAQSREITFTPLSEVHDHTALFKRMTRTGEAALNAHRYYRTGKDM